MATIAIDSQGRHTHTPGQVAYDAYAASTGNVSLVSGAELPPWDALTPAIRDAWEAAGSAVAVELTRQQGESVQRVVARANSSW